MKRVLVISHVESRKIHDLLNNKGFDVVKKDPEFIVCYGGDGTILFAERKFPQTPKLIIKKSRLCRKCDYRIGVFSELLHRIKNQEFEIIKEMKLEAEHNNKRLIGLNEIQLHTKLPFQAVRFALSYDGVRIADLIGDGVVIATPFGSTAYYKSTGGEEFKRGIGISFNNIHNEKMVSIIISQDSIIKIRINRGPALMVADNNENYFELNKEDVASIRKSKESASFIYFPK